MKGRGVMLRTGWIYGSEGISGRALSQFQKTRGGRRDNSRRAGHHKNFTTSLPARSLIRPHLPDFFYLIYPIKYQPLILLHTSYTNHRRRQRTTTKFPDCSAPDYAASAHRPRRSSSPPRTGRQLLHATNCLQENGDEPGRRGERWSNKVSWKRTRTCDDIGSCRCRQCALS